MANTPYFTKAESEAKNKETFRDIKSTVQSISAGEGGIVYDTLAEAQGLATKPSDGTIFQVSKITDPTSAGYYTFQSTETNGTRFEKEFFNDDFLNISTDLKQINKFLSGFQFSDTYSLTGGLPETTFSYKNSGKKILFTSSSGTESDVNFIAQKLAPTKVEAQREYKLKTTVETLVNTDPAISLGWYDGDTGQTPAKQIAYRSSGSIFILEGVNVAGGLQRTGSSEHSYVAGDEIEISMKVEVDGSISVYTTKNGNKSEVLNIPIIAPVDGTGFIGIGSRGRVNVIAFLEVINTQISSVEKKINSIGLANAIPNNSYLDKLKGWERELMPEGVNSGSINIELVNENNPFSSKSRKATALSVTGSANFSGIAIRLGSFFSGGDTLIFKGLLKKSLVSDNPRIAVRIKDSLLNTLSTEYIDNITNDADVWYESGDFEFTLPANAKWIFIYAQTWSINESISMVGWTLLKKSQSLKDKYIINRYTQNAGIVINVNSQNSFQDAIGELQGGSGTIIVDEGDYRENVNFSSFSSGNVRIVGKPNSQVRILGSDKLSFTKTAGYTNIYEANFASVFPSREIIYEDGRLSNPISDTERHPLQKSLTHRTPFTHITKKVLNTDLATTLAALDSEPGKFYFDGNKVYIHTTDSDNPSINGYSYEVPQREPASSTSDGSTAKIELENLSFCFSSNYGLNTGKAGTVLRKNVRVIGANNDGIKDDANTVISYNDEICDARDGVNGHFNRIANWDAKDSRYGKPMHYYFGQWSHDNTDDGNSHHERGQVFTKGCLFEYNKKSGIAPSNTCQWTDHYSLCRQNKGNPSFGEGVEIINNPIGNDKGFGVVFTGFGTICENNRKGFRVTSSLNNRAVLWNCISRNNDDVEYEADEGKIYANNCRVSNSDSLKLKVLVGTGEIIVFNDDILT